MSVPKKFRGKITGSDVRLVKVFCTIVECGGFAAAEPVLQIGLPAISRCVSDLEIRTGVTVCRRGKAGFALTEQGLLLYDYGKKLLLDIERFEQEIFSLNAEVSGTLRLAVVDALITDKSFRLTEVINNFCYVCRSRRGLLQACWGYFTLPNAKQKFPQMLFLIRNESLKL